MPFNLFRKKKPEQEAQVNLSQESKPQSQLEETTQIQQESPPTPTIESTPESIPPPQEEQTQPTTESTTEQNPEVNESQKAYLKAMPLRELSDLEKVKDEVQNGNIIILKVTPLAQKSIEDVKSAVNDLYHFSETIGGDIARLGEERVVICPKTIRIWREKSPKPVTNESLPTAA